MSQIVLAKKVVLMSEINECKMCQRLKSIKTDRLLIRELDHSYLLLGDHQYFNGYCVVMYKNHVREMHDLPLHLQSKLMSEVVHAAKIINLAFRPWKINYSCYGNVVEHIHWHIFPRYQSDPDLRVHPWLHSAKFNEFVSTPEQVTRNIELINKTYLETLSTY